MYINEYELIKIMLTDYGFLSDGDEEFSIYDFKKYFENNIDSVEKFDYDEAKMCFYLYVNYNHKKKVYLINLADKHKKLLAEGKADEDVLILMNRVKKIQKEKRKEEIIKTTRTTGNSPTSVEDIRLYAEYLQEQLKETKADIRSSCRLLSIPVLLGIITQASCQNGAIPYLLNNNNTLTGFLLTVASMFGIYLTIGSAYIVYFDHEETTSAITYLKKELKEFKSRYLKLAKLRLKCEQLGLLKKGQSIKELPTAEEDDFTYEVPSSIKM